MKKMIFSFTPGRAVCHNTASPGRRRRWLPFALMTLLWLGVAMAPAEMMGQENTAVACSDGIDNDGDGLIDCQDPQCQGAVELLTVDGTFESCSAATTPNNATLATCNAGWTNSVGSADVISNPTFYNPSPQGGNFVMAVGSLSTPPGTGEAIKATVSGLTVGQDYTIQFYQTFMGWTGAADAVGELAFWQVNIGATQTQDAPEEAFAGFSNQVWTQVQLTFTADAGSMDIEWYAKPGSDGNGTRDFMAIDDIQVFIANANPDPIVCPDESTPALCSDGVDNDGDGLIDCDDPSCLDATAATNLLPGTGNFDVCTSATTPNFATLPTCDANWINSMASPDVISNPSVYNPSPESGNNFIMAVGSSTTPTGPEAIQTTITGLTVGEEYVVRFYQTFMGWTGAADIVGEKARWEVNFGAAQSQFAPEEVFAGFSNQVWTEVKLVFTAGATSMDLEFRADEGTDGPGTRDFLAIDDIIVFSKAEAAACIAPTATITANDDAFSGQTPGSITPTVFTNDDVDGTTPATDALVTTPTVVADGGLTGVTFNADGTINIPAGAANGTYVLTYEICLEADPSTCDQAVVTIDICNLVVPSLIKN